MDDLIRSNAEAAVQATAAAYNKGDIDEIMAMFEPDIIATWNGAIVARNADELRAWFLGGMVGQATSLTIEKTLMVATEDTIGTHWRHVASYKNGQTVDGCGNEFWTVRNGRAATWNAVGVETPRS
ncbi:MAG: nuclear transport factor 2 family protein [Sphingomonadaceae bacterium]|nr:nuclear transport factor 2 family protein [Sphingomonadaceae bacterium]